MHTRWHRITPPSSTLPAAAAAAATTATVVAHRLGSSSAGQRSRRAVRSVTASPGARHLCSLRRRRGALARRSHTVSYSRATSPPTQGVYGDFDINLNQLSPCMLGTTVHAWYSHACSVLSADRRAFGLRCPNCMRSGLGGWDQGACAADPAATTADPQSQLPAEPGVWRAPPRRRYLRLPPRRLRLCLVGPMAGQSVPAGAGVAAGDAAETTMGQTAVSVAGGGMRHDRVTVL